MQLDSQQLTAFYAVVQAGHFGRAAEKLGITQSALSQRIMKLEQQLATNLIIRAGRSLTLTSAGTELVKYIRVQDELEQETIALIANQAFSVGGVARIGAYSSVLNSILMPALATTLQEHPNLRVELINSEMRALESLLISGQVDFILTTLKLNRNDLVEYVLGREEQVTITTKNGRNDQYLDHDVEDQTTFDFLKAQNLPYENIKRSYVGDVFNIIRGVELGMGMGVVSRHLVEGNACLLINRSKTKVYHDVYLYEHRRPYSSKTMEHVRREIIKNFPLHLKN